MSAPVNIAEFADWAEQRDFKIRTALEHGVITAWLVGPERWRPATWMLRYGMHFKAATLPHPRDPKALLPLEVSAADEQEAIKALFSKISTIITDPQHQIVEGSLLEGAPNRQFRIIPDTWTIEPASI